MHDLEYAEEFEIDSPLGEVEEMEEAARLLEIIDEAELNQFIGNLLKKATKVAGSVLKPPVGRILGGYAKGAIKKALPGIGNAAGGFPVPDEGAAIGGQVASRAGQLLGLELEGLSAEDQEFEVAKQLVRFIGSAAQKAAQVAGARSGEAAAKRAVFNAARKHAPGLLRSRNGDGSARDTDRADEFETESPFSEIEEMEEAASLLEITDEAELDQFIGKLLRKATQVAGRALKTPVGRALGGYVKGAIKKSLPGIGSAAGVFPVPDEGVSDGTQVAPPGLEPQSLSPEDQEFEVAKQLVRVAGAAAQKAASMPAAAAPVTAAKVAVTEAARRHAPGLLRGAAAAPDGPGSCPCRSRQAGRWIRRGREILLLDI